MDRESPYMDGGFYVIVAHAIDEGECFPETQRVCHRASTQ